MGKFSTAAWTIAVVAWAFDPGSTGSAQAPAGSSPAVTEELIVEKDAGAAPDDEADVVSADGRSVAWRTGTGKNWGVMLNGARQGGTFDEVKSLAFSPDGKHLAFTGRRDKGWRMVRGGVEAPQAFGKVSEPLFSPDGQRLVYFGESKGKWSVILDGEPAGAPFDDLEDAMFSPDGQRLAVAGRRQGKLVVLVDGKEGPRFDVVGGMRFSGDGRRFAYAGADIKSGLGSDRGVGRVIVDGEAGPSFEAEKPRSALGALALGGPISLVAGYFTDLTLRLHGVSSPVFSPDGSRVAYGAHREKDDEVVFVNGAPGERFEAIVTEPRFSPDGKRMAYAARRGKDDEVLVVDGVPGARFKSIVAGPQFSDDGSRVAWAAASGEGRFLVADGERVGAALLDGAEFVADPIFSPDGRRVLYSVSSGSFWATFARNLATGINTGERARGKRAKCRAYVDGEPGPEYDVGNLSGFQFSRDGRHVIYVAHRSKEASREVSFVVTDRTEGKRYDSVWTRTLAVVEGRALTYVARAGRKFLRVTQPLE